VLDESVQYQGKVIKYVVAHARYANPLLADLRSGAVVHCNLTQVTEMHARSGDPTDLSWWRGGTLGLIGSVRMRWQD
jgi:hypothetical protein